MSSIQIPDHKLLTLTSLLDKFSTELIKKLDYTKISMLDGMTAFLYKGVKFLTIFIYVYLFA